MTGAGGPAGPARGSLGSTDDIGFRADGDAMWLVEPVAVSTGPDLERRSSRSMRWAMQHTVAALLPGERVAACGHRVVPGSAPALVRAGDGGGVYYSGVRACGSVWVCPHCAAKIARARVVELRAAVKAAKREGLHVSMFTFTVGHSRFDDLGGLVEGLTGAMRSWRSGRVWQRLAAVVGYVGSVRNLEVTVGPATGWHPHAHALLFTRHRIDRATYDALASRWSKCVGRRGGYASVEHGLTMTDDSRHVAGYLAKAEAEVAEAEGREPVREWGAACELTMAHTKRTRDPERVNAWGLLRQCVEGGHAEAPFWFMEYASVFAGRRQLVWSRGLRALLGIGDEVSDVEVAEAAGDVHEVLHVFSSAEWRLVLRHRLRGDLLDVAEDYGAEGVTSYLAWASKQYGGLRGPTGPGGAGLLA